MALLCNISYTLYKYRILHYVSSLQLLSSSTPLNSSLKIHLFVWSDAYEYAFSYLNDSMCNARILAMFDFIKGFILELHASRRDLGVVFM